MRKILSLFFISIVSFWTTTTTISCSSKKNSSIKTPSYKNYNFFNNDQGKVFIQNNFSGDQIKLNDKMNLYKILYGNVSESYKTRILRQINGNLNTKDDGLFNDQNMLEKLENNLLYKADNNSIKSYQNFIDKSYANIQNMSINDLDNKVSESNNGSKLKLSTLGDPNIVNKPATIYSWIRLLYGALEELIGWKNTSHLLYHVSLKSAGNSVATTFFELGNGLQTISFSDGFANWGTIKFQNQIGFWGTNNIAAVITHEYGHVLSNYISIAPNDRTKTNAGNNVNNINYFDKWLESWFTGYLSNHYCHISPENKKWSKLASFAIVNSNYGRISGDADMFAEAFEIWLLEPLQTDTQTAMYKFDSKSQKFEINYKNLNVSWEILNDFFLNIFKTAYKV